VQILVPVIVAGLALGLLYGLLGAAAVLLFKATGVVNFAEGRLGTLLVFVIWGLTEAHWPMALAVTVTLALAVLLGEVIYWVVIRPNLSAGALNITIRTLGLYLLIFALVNDVWGAGQPFSFPGILPQSVWVVLGVRIPTASVAILGISACIIACSAWFFASTSLGLEFRALSERPDVAALLGVNVHRLSGIAWGFSCVISLVVALMIVSIRGDLTSDAMDVYLLYGFAAAIVGGLTSLGGAFWGGLIIGVIDSLASAYTDSTVSGLLIFVAVVAMLLVRPSGLFGRSVSARL